MGAAGSGEGALVPVPASLVAFDLTGASAAGKLPADGAGQFYVFDPIVTALPLGNAAIQIRVWYNNGLYASYEAAAAAGNNVGKSAVMTINLKAPSDWTAQSLNDISIAAFTVGTAPAAPTIALANNGTQVPAGSLLAGSTANVLLKFQTAVTVANATLNTVNFTTAGTYAAADLSNLKLLYNASSSFSGATQIGSSLTGIGIGVVAPSFSALTQTIISSSTGYFFITAGVAPGATPGRTLSVNAIGNSDLTFASGSPTGGPTSAGGTQTITGTTVNTLASSLNPSTFGSSVTFTATVSPSAASGTVNFKDGTSTLGTGTLSSGTATFTTNGLSLGDHLLTAEYSGDATYTASASSVWTQSVYVVTTAVNDTLGAWQNTNTIVAASVLTANDIWAAIYPATITNVTYTGTNGGAVLLAGTNVIYTPASNYVGSDVFTYTIADGHGGTAVGSLAVSVQEGGGNPPSSIGGIIIEGGTVKLSFRGVPLRTYQVQATESLVTPNWQTLGTATASRTGVITYQDTPPGGSGTRFYRIRPL